MVADPKTLPAVTPAARRKAAFAALRSAVKGSGWRHKQGVLVSVEGPFVLIADLLATRTALNAPRKLRVSGKPRRLDHMLWEAMGIEGNHDKPATFHAWGAFVCGAPLLQTVDVPADLSPEAEAAWIVQTASDLKPRAMEQLQRAPFSQLAQQAYEVRDARAMAETLVLALVDEGDLDAARAAAAAATADRRITFSNLNHPSFGEKAGKTAVDLALTMAQRR